jgi:hypothetical protein
MFTYDSDAEGNAEWNLYPCLWYKVFI